MLDKKVLKTPLKRDLFLPNLNLAQEIVKEWDQDSKKINTEAMIFYGLISTSVDKIIDNKNLYINDILDYINTDLICYRAENPKELVELQKKKWDPIILLIEKYIGTKVRVFEGVLPKKQHATVHDRLDNLINQFDIFEISVLHRITNITGSIFLSLCVLKKDISKNEVFELSFLDELWQAENWGLGEETIQKRKEISIELNKSIFFLDCL
jgi:chaperone required for assembly of F1-ATPase